jgi:PAS domain S-box-containing protein
MADPDTRPGASGLEREFQLRGIIESAMDAIITADRNGRVVLFNRAAELAFGCPAARIVGGSIERLIPRHFRTIHQVHMQAFALSGEASKTMGAARVGEGPDRAGTA